MRIITFASKYTFWPHHEVIIRKIKYRVALKLAKKMHFLVRGGPYDGMQLISNLNWNKNDLGSVLLGSYERCVAEYILKSDFDYFIDIGSADGVHLVGVGIKRPDTLLIGYEINTRSRQACTQLAELNSVGITLRRKMDYNEMQILLKEIEGKRALFLCDIEGGEYDLFDRKMLKQLLNHTLIIELHEFDFNNSIKARKLIDQSQEFFDVQFLSSRSHFLTTHSSLNRYSDDLSLLLLSESRPTAMRYLVLEPK